MRVSMNPSCGDSLAEVSCSMLAASLGTEFILTPSFSIREQIEKEGVKMNSVPKLAASMEQLTSAKLSPQEGFMLTRINGTYDISAIVKITPMPQIDALLSFWKLAKAGHIT